MTKKALFSTKRTRWAVLAILLAGSMVIWISRMVDSRHPTDDAVPVAPIVASSGVPSIVVGNLPGSAAPKTDSSSPFGGFRAYGYAENNKFDVYCQRSNSLRLFARNGKPPSDAHSQTWIDKRTEGERAFRRNPNDGASLLIACLYQKDAPCVGRVLDAVCPPENP